MNTSMYNGFLLAFLILNIITFFAFAIDKQRSRIGSRRISEKTLLILSALGGTPAALIAMNYFRHKTKKLSFGALLIIILALQVSFVVWFLQFREAPFPTF